jgi:hypothetical protein
MPQVGQLPRGLDSRKQPGRRGPLPGSAIDACRCQLACLFLLSSPPAIGIGMVTAAGGHSFWQQVGEGEIGALMVQPPRQLG